MYIVFDYRCPECGHEEERFVRREAMDDQAHFCIPEGTFMVRLPAGTRTTFRFADTNLKR